MVVSYERGAPVRGCRPEGEDAVGAARVVVHVGVFREKNFRRKTTAAAGKDNNSCSIHATNDRTDLYHVCPCDEIIQSCEAQGPLFTVKEIGRPESEDAVGAAGVLVHVGCSRRPQVEPRFHH